MFGLARRPAVTIYTTPGCAACAAVKRYLDSKEVRYRELDVATCDRHLADMVRASGVRIAPVTVVGSEAFYGDFGRQRPLLEAALKRARLL